MSLKKIINNQVIGEAQGNLYYIGVKTSALNTIRQLQDRTITFSAAQIEGYAEAYFDAPDGRLNSVNTSNTTAEFDTDKYAVPSWVLSDNLVYMDIYATDVDSAIEDVANNVELFELETGHYRLISYKGSIAEARNRLFTALFYLATTTPNHVTGLTELKYSESSLRGLKVQYLRQYFTEPAVFRYAGQEVVTEWTQTSGKMHVLGDYLNGANNNTGHKLDLSMPKNTILHTQTSSLLNNFNTSDYHFSETSDGLKMRPYTSASSNVVFTKDCRAVIAYENDLTRTTTKVDFTADPTITESSIFNISSDAPDGSIEIKVEHTIPSGTFNSTINSGVCVPKIEDWETGANIQYKFQNATEDSGWFDYTEVANFTAFTSEPTKFILRFVPTDTSPTSGYPSVNGVWYYAK